MKKRKTATSSPEANDFELNTGPAGPTHTLKHNPLVQGFCEGMKPIAPSDITEPTTTAEAAKLLKLCQVNVDKKLKPHRVWLCNLEQAKRWNFTIQQGPQAPKIDAHALATITAGRKVNTTPALARIRSLAGK